MDMIPSDACAKSSSVYWFNSASLIMYNRFKYSVLQNQRFEMIGISENYVFKCIIIIQAGRPENDSKEVMKTWAAIVSQKR